MLIEPEAPQARTSAVAADGRLVSIDILRGLAILWVIVLHLWADMTLNLEGARPLYIRLRDRIGEGDPRAMLGAFGELVLGSGNQGVAMFMILSGLSLTLNAYRRPEPGLMSGYARRLRKLLVPYWGGVLTLTGTVAAMALLLVIVDGGSFREQWWNVRIGAMTPVRVQWDDVLWALSVFGWMFRQKLATVPVGSLWFVSLLVQYYLLFPFALRLLRRVGPWRLVILGLAITVACRWLLLSPAFDWVGPAYISRLLPSMAFFRGSEFFLGMALGYLLVNDRDAVGEWIRTPLDVASLVVIAFLLQMAGGVLGPMGGLYLGVSDVLVQVALVVYMLPLLFKAPGFLERTVVARALVYLGVVSYTALIVNDAMRYLASFLRYEEMPDAAWWFFLVVIYVPVGTLIARPLARLFGLLPEQRTPATGAEAAAAYRPDGELQPAGG